MISAHNIASLIGRNAVDAEGKKIGAVGQVFVNPANGRPNWVTVKTGWFGRSETFVPLEGADEVDGDLRVPFTKDTVKDAPRIDSDAELTPAHEDELYAYYAEHLPQAASATETETETATAPPTEHGTVRLRRHVVPEAASDTHTPNPPTDR